MHRRLLPVRDEQQSLRDRVQVPGEPGNRRREDSVRARRPERAANGGCIAYAGKEFSQGVIHMLRASPCRVLLAGGRPKRFNGCHERTGPCARTAFRVVGRAHRQEESCLGSGQTQPRPCEGGGGRGIRAKRGGRRTTPEGPWRRHVSAGNAGIRARSHRANARCGVTGAGSLRPPSHFVRVAEGEGFEPPVPFRVQRYSRPPPSTTRPSLRCASILSHGGLFQCNSPPRLARSARTAERRPV